MTILKIVNTSCKNEPEKVKEQAARLSDKTTTAGSTFCSAPDGA